MPQYGPKGVMAVRLNDTAIRVTWEPLTLIEARGFITNYTIILQLEEDRKKIVDYAITKTVPDNVTTATVADLVPNANYIVSVSASTSAGTSINNSNIIVESFKLYTPEEGQLSPCI